jgi:Fic family protein
MTRRSVRRAGFLPQLSTKCYIHFDVDISASLEAVRHLPPRAAIAREAARLRREELDGSLALAGTPLTREQVNALVDRGISTGDHRFEHYLTARDLATGAAWVAEQRTLGAADPRPLITVEDIRRLHTFATAGQPQLRPGMWRLAVDPVAAGIIPLPPWLIAKETGVLADRFRRRPAPADLSAWLAAFLVRYARIRPFMSANGRSGRLAAALLLRRLDGVPLAFGRARAPAYRRALLGAEGGDLQPLCALIEATLVQSARRLIAAAGDEPLEPLRALAGTNYAALIKAVKRGRLAAVVRDGRVFTTAGWIADYRNSSR